MAFCLKFNFFMYYSTYLFWGHASVSFPCVCKALAWLFISKLPESVCFNMSLVVPKHSWVLLCEPCDNCLFLKICKISTFKLIPLADIFDLPLISILMSCFVFMAPSEILFHKMVCVFFALLLAHFSLSAMTKLGYFQFLSSPLLPLCAQVRLILLFFSVLLVFTFMP